MGSIRKEYTFYWYIENYTFCWHGNGTSLFSPNFTVDKFQCTTWQLELYPRGEEVEDKGHISLFLNRDTKSGGPEKVSFCFELSCLTADGSTLCDSDYDYEFLKGDGYGSSQFLDKDEIFFHRKSDYLPQDVLTVRCRMWTGEGNVQHIGLSCGRTRIKVEKNSFLHEVEKFSTLQPNIKHTINIRSHSKKRCFLYSSLYFTKSLLGEEEILIEIIPFDTNQILHKCDFSLLKKSGKVVECGVTDYVCDAERKNAYTIPLSLTREVILNRKIQYLPRDKLSLICECTFSSGIIEFERIEETFNELPLGVIKKKSNSVPRKTTRKLSIYPTVMEDMKSLFIDQRLTDVKLKTETKSFSAHKIVLCARSPVFNAMLTSEMKEKITDCINIDDLEDDVVHRLLLFLYSDKIEDLQWESATQLYYAADKYQIGKLKEICSSFLAENLCPTNAGEVLLLADTHNDSDLKKLVQDFILEHEDEI